MKAKILLLLISNIFYFGIAYGQKITPEKLRLKAFSINDKSLGQINYYITANQFEKQKPILLYLDGSGPYPLFQYTSRGIGSTVLINYRKLSEKYHVILISKPGVPFVDSVKMDAATGFPYYTPPAEYKKRLSLDWRVAAVNAVLAEVMKTVKYDKNNIAVLGVSEGFQVGAKLVSVNKKITQAVLLVGNGLSQFYDSIVQNRTDGQIGKISPQQAQKNIDSLMNVFKNIYANGKSVDKEWYGHTYLRWNSFGQNIPLENLLAVNIPVYIIAASNDINTSVLSTDYLYLESIRKGKNNITYKVYPYDHMFNEMVKDQSGRVLSMKNHTSEVIDEALSWLDKNQS